MTKHIEHDAALSRAIAAELSIPPGQTERTIALMDEGNTIPFLARYRKEATGGLDETQLRSLQEALARRRALEERRAAIIASLSEQGVLSDALRSKVEAADKLTALEDLYLPYRPKRRTRAMMARERGLGPLADLMKRPGAEPPLSAARRFVSPDKDVASPEDALSGARDILAEEAAEDADIRGRARRVALADALLTAKKAPKAEDPQGKYSQYYAFSESLPRLQPHRVLACDRGEAEGVLKVNVELPDARILGFLHEHFGVRAEAWRAEVEAALADGYKRLLAPALERDLRAALTEKAQAHAITVFAANLKSLLLQPPLRGRVVLGIDPGYRTGCKVVVVDPTGTPLMPGFAIYPHEPQRQRQEAIATLRTLVSRHGVNVVAIGNGTASRETEQVVAEAIRGTDARYLLVSEAGASVYSASEVAREEFPELDATQRGTISIARRLQDPLAELVKIDPQAIGVGLYQHDLDQKALGSALSGVVEDAVNHVGVDLNTASAALLTHVAGLNKKVAAAIVKQRQTTGAFRRRADLKKVKGLGDRTFEQCAGFLRIPGGAEPLDNTAIHPESYAATRQLLERLGLSASDKALAPLIQGVRADAPRLASALGVGEPTLRDILANLEKPGRDPREDLAPPHLRQDVLKVEDLQPGMRLMGTVRNVVDFGAFVDIGVKNDGLVHVSELSDRFVRNPLEVVGVGDVVEVEVLEVDRQRGRVSLSRKRVLNGRAT
ncbi:MAG TPA: Tex family protein [Pantanalinema sp.]